MACCGDGETVRGIIALLESDDGEGWFQGRVYSESDGKGKFSSKKSKVLGLYGVEVQPRSRRARLSRRL